MDTNEVHLTPTPREVTLPRVSLPLNRRALACALLLAACNTAPPPSSDSPASTTPAPAPPPAPSAAAPRATTSATSPTAVPTISVAQMAKDKGITLIDLESPTSAGVDTLPLITVSKTELLVEHDRIATVFSGPLGFEAEIKRQGQRAALEVLPLGAALKAVHAADTSQTTVRVLLDRETSYRTALEVYFTAAHSGFTAFDFVVASKAGERSVPANTPSRAEWDAAHATGYVTPPSFVFQASGVTLTVGDINIGAGCTKGGVGPAVASASGKLDAHAIGACAARIKAMSPEWNAFTVANVSATGDLDMTSILGAVEAILPSLPIVHFGLLSG